MKQTLAPIVSHTEIMPGVYLVWFKAPGIAMAAQPGQFITVCCEGLILRRPFSIHQVTSNQVALLFKVVGRGTSWLSERQTGDKIDILGPLGGGFSIQSTSRNLLLLAGGIGIAPLQFLAQRAVSSSRYSITLIHGASTAAQLYPQRLLPREVQFIPVTEDGTMGRKAMVTDILLDFLPWADQVYACGPLDMYKQLTADSYQLKATSCHSEERSDKESGAERPKNLSQDKTCWESKLKKCQVSLEVRMGCGIGACYGCTINTKKGLKQVCRDGPIFKLDDILWEEVKL